MSATPFAHPVVPTAADWQLHFPYTPENLPRILAMQEIMRSWPAEKRATTAWEKGLRRLEDARRLAAGEINAEELQRENSVFPPGATFRYVDLVGDLSHIRPEQWQETYQRLLQEEGPVPRAAVPRN